LNIRTLLKLSAQVSPLLRDLGAGEVQVVSDAIVVSVALLCRDTILINMTTRTIDTGMAQFLT
jgi:hypothetical protein